MRNRRQWKRGEVDIRVRVFTAEQQPNASIEMMKRLRNMFREL